MDHLKIYIDKLCLNLPQTLIPGQGPLHIDLVLEGGLFNGSYLIGVAYFLKILENNNQIVIDRISGTSIGALVALLYFTDNLDLAESMYYSIYTSFQKNMRLSHYDDIFKQAKEKILSSCPIKRIYSLLKRKIYITYHNVVERRQTLRNKYNSLDDIIDSIKRSSFIPYVTSNTFCYKQKYLDGLYPYIFKIQQSQAPLKKILYVNIHTFDKIADMVMIKNERTNLHRILLGVLDFHLFLIKQKKTVMCSYVNDWYIADHLSSGLFRLSGKIMFIFLCRIYMIYHLIYHLIYQIIQRFITPQIMDSIADHIYAILQIIFGNLRFLNAK
jgi:hypothetical protein